MTATKTEGTKGTKKAARKRCSICGRRVALHKLETEHGPSKCCSPELAAALAATRADQKAAAKTTKKVTTKTAGKQAGKKTTKAAPKAAKKTTKVTKKTAPHKEAVKGTEDRVNVDMGLGHDTLMDRGTAERMNQRRKKNGEAPYPINGKAATGKAKSKATASKAAAKAKPKTVAKTTPAPKATKDQRSDFDAALAAAKPKPKKNAPRSGPPRSMQDPRMPAVGSTIDSKPVPEYGGGHVVTVEIVEMGLKPRGTRPDGQPWTRETYKSPTAVIREARGRNTSDGLNGWWWFGFQTSTGSPQKKTEDQ